MLYLCYICIVREQVYGRNYYCTRYPSYKKAGEIIRAAFAFDDVWGYKIGPQLFYPNFSNRDEFLGMLDVARHLFLDMKFHDTPDTVAGAIRGVKNLNPKIITIHSQGGYKMMQDAVKARDEAWATVHPKPLIIAVTILTSIDDDVWGRMNNVPKEYIFDNLLDEAVFSGVDGVVCSGQEVGWIKN